MNMKIIHHDRNIFFAVVCLMLSITVSAQDYGKRYELSVNPFIGTDFHGHTYPGAVAPFGMVQVSADTRLEGWDGCSGYHYSDSTVYGFSHTHLSGTGCSDYGDFLFIPTCKDKSAKDLSMRFSHKNEKAHAGYYELTSWNTDTVTTQLTANRRTAYHRYTFQNTTKERYIVIDLNHRDLLLDYDIRVINPKTVVGYRRSSAWNQDQRVYFAARFNRSIVSSDFDSTSKRMFLCFGKNTSEKDSAIEVMVCLSSVNEQGALKNLNSEKCLHFDKARVEAEKTWRKELGKIEIETSNEELKKVFYTALYHCMICPNLYSDTDGLYRGMDNAIHLAKDYERYTVFSLWDTYRTLHPLLALIDRKRSTDFAKTALDIYSQSGFLPMWELSSYETYCMIGMHGTSMLADLYTKGMVADKERTLEAMIESAKKGKFGFDVFERNGYISSEYEHEGVSKSVEYAYNMYCIATVAKLQGREDLYREYIAKAQYYKNLFNPANTFIQPKENGRFTPDFDPTQIDQNYTEGNGWHYTFYAPHDINTLIDLMGGDETFCTKLDSCFFTDSKTSGRVQADVTGLIGQYCHGNEPSQHTAYLYAYAGKAYRTQELVRRILTELYSNRPDGICGNDDAGQMSAWFVMSAMGFYPVCPASNQYVIGAPLFDKVTINLENGKKFEIIAQGAEQNAYVRSLKLNGKEYDKTYLNYDDIKDGGVLEFAMTDKPIMEFGRAESSRPTSRIKDNLICISPSLSYEGTGTFTDSLTVDVNAFCKDDTIVVEFGDGTCRNFLGEGSFSIHDSRNIVIYAKNGTSSQSVECRFYKIPKGRSIKILTKYDPQYTAGGDQGLIDLKRGTDNWKLGCWQGYWGEDLEAVIDLGEKQRIKRVGGNFIQDEKSWIFMPLTVEYYVSDDGINFRLLEKIDNEIPQDKSGCITHTFFTSKEINARYIKIKAKNTGVNPDWHLSKGEKAWLFTDEIIIE